MSERSSSSPCADHAADSPSDGMSDSASLKTPNLTNTGLLIGLLVFLSGFGVLVGLTWFLCDDAFISFRYVRNLVEGNGLVFNTTERVEGYTNFLWVLEIAALWFVLSIPPQFSSIALSIGCTLWVFYMVFNESGKHEHGARKNWITLLAFGVLLSSTTFATWTTSGLETRQFTALTVAAVYAASRYRSASGMALRCSLFAGLAALTRPEGMLVGCVCIGFIVADSWWRRSFCWGLVLKASVPFAAIVGGHFLFRYAYYGMWLPNTYYAKHVRPWFESGFDYFTVAGIETGAYLLVPLALLGAWLRSQKNDDHGAWLSVGLVGAHIAYVMRVGGDHFEFRPLDFYWPLLLPLTAEGLVSLCSRLSAQVSSRLGRELSVKWFLIPAGILVIFYSSVIQIQVMWESRRHNPLGVRPLFMQVPLNPENSAWLFKVPLMPMLCNIANLPRERGIAHCVGTRLREHKCVGYLLERDWGKLDDVERPFLPKGSVASTGMVGYMPYYLPDVEVIDIKGLTDATVAQTKVETPNLHRLMAHDRNPPPGYLHERRINIFPHPPVDSKETALSLTIFAKKLKEGMWLPFDAIDHEWVAKSFKPETLAARYLLASKDDSKPTFRFGGKNFEMGRVLEDFEDDAMTGWNKNGQVKMGPSGARVKTQGLVFGRLGEGILSSYDEEHGDSGLGSASSPTYKVEHGEWLFMLVSGGAQGNMRVEVKVDGKVAGNFRGKDDERMELVGMKLPECEACELQINVVDQYQGAWGHLNLDHVFIATPKEGVALSGLMDTQRVR